MQRHDALHRKAWEFLTDDPVGQRIRSEYETANSKKQRIKSLEHLAERIGAERRDLASLEAAIQGIAPESVPETLQPQSGEHSDGDAHPKPTLSVKDPAGNDVTFQARSHDRPLTLVDADKLREAWKENSDNYVEPGNKNELEGRIENFGEWMDKRGEQPVEPPRISVRNGQVDFADGRHRFNWFLQNGWKQVPVESWPEDTNHLQERFSPRETAADPAKVTSSRVFTTTE
jgi:hypothetical protein